MQSGGVVPALLLVEKPRKQSLLEGRALEGPPGDPEPTTGPQELPFIRLTVANTLQEFCKRRNSYKAPQRH